MRLDTHLKPILQNINWHTRTVFTQPTIECCANLFHITTKNIGGKIIHDPKTCVGKILSVYIFMILLHQLPAVRCCSTIVGLFCLPKILTKIVRLCIFTIQFANEINILVGCRARSKINVMMRIIKPSNLVWKTLCNDQMRTNFASFYHA